MNFQKKVMFEPSSKALFENILYKSDLCAFATSSLEGKPEVATIEYYVDEDYNLYFESFPTYRKYHNIISNPLASAVITKDQKTLQMDGEVKQLDGSDAEWAKQKLIEKFGDGVGYLHAPDVLFFRFTPTWIRVLVDGSYPPRYEMIRGQIL